MHDRIYNEQVVDMLSRSLNSELRSQHKKSFTAQKNEINNNKTVKKV